MFLLKATAENKINDNPIISRNSFFKMDKLLNLPSLCIMDSITPIPSSQARVGNIKKENSGFVLVRITQATNDTIDITAMEATAFLLNLMITDRIIGRKI